LSYLFAMRSVDPAALRSGIVSLADTCPERLLAALAERWGFADPPDEWVHEALGLVRDRDLTHPSAEAVDHRIAGAVVNMVDDIRARAHESTWSGGFHEFVAEDLARLWGRPDLYAVLMERGLFGVRSDTPPWGGGWLAPDEAAACLAAWDAAGDGRLDGVSEDEAAVEMTDALRRIAADGRHAVFLYG